MSLIVGLDKIKRGKKTKLVAGFVTILIIAMLIFSGPASAITVNLTLQSGDESTGVYDYKAVIDIHTNDVIPLDLVYIQLTDMNSSEVSNCYYDFTTKALNDTYSDDPDRCSKVTITNITNNAAYTTSYGYNYGYGYGNGSGYSEGLNNISWNYGYGYGYANGYGYNSFTETLSSTGEVIIYFTVNSSATQFSMGNSYSISAGIAGLDSAVVDYTYYNKDTVSFVGKGLDATAPIVTITNLANDTLLSTANLPYNLTGNVSDAMVGVNFTSFYQNGILNQSSVQYSTPGVFWSQLWSPADGKYNLTIRACDYSNNCANASVSNIVVDTTAPVFGNVSNITTYVNTSVAHNFAITDLSSIISNTTNNGNFSMNASGYLRNITALVAGETYQVTVTAVDAASKSRQATIFITVLGSTSVLATSATTTLVNGTTEVIFNGLSGNVSSIVIPSTILEDTEITLDMGALLNTSTYQIVVPNALTLSRQGTSQNYSALIQAGTIIIGNATWDGKITLPTVKAASGYNVDSGDVNIVIDLGSSQELNFSKSVKIVMGGMAGKTAAWSRGTTLTKISTVCNSGNTTNTTSPSNINTASPRECSLDDSSDLVVWTYHFTKFAAYTPTTTTDDSSSSGSSGAVVISATESELAAGYTNSLEIGDVLKFKINGESHQVVLMGIKNGNATLRFSSGVITVSMIAGEEKSLDLNADGVNDLLVKVTDVTSNKATLTLKTISASATETTPEDDTTTVEPTTGVGETMTKVAKSWITWLVVAIIIILAIIVYILYRRNHR